MRRLRLASCLLADVAWQANPNFRADRGIEMALHGNWVAVNPSGRVIMAQALSANFGRDRLPEPRLAQLCREEDLKRAHCWGLAMRLGQRLSGGVGSVLKRTALALNNGAIELSVRRGEEALIGDQVERRLLRLAQALGCETVLAVQVRGFGRRKHRDRARPPFSSDSPADSAGTAPAHWPHGHGVRREPR